MEDDYHTFLNDLADVEEQLKIDPNNSSLLDLKKELLEGIGLIEEALPHLKEESQTTKPTKAPTKHDATSHHASAATTDGIRFFNPNDQVQARRRGEPFTPATVLSVLGPPSNPNYVVRFKADRSTATVPGYDVRPAIAPNVTSDGKKRKVDDDESTSTSLPSKPANVISAPAALNPEFLKQKESAGPNSLDDAGRDKKSRKVGSTKKLEEGRSSWQNFQGNMKRKQKTKESMFRTGEGMNARVGVIGSGQGMRKDQKRQKNEYSRVDEYDE